MAELESDDNISEEKIMNQAHNQMNDGKPPEVDELVEILEDQKESKDSVMEASDSKVTFQDTTELSSQMTVSKQRDKDDSNIDLSKYLRTPNDTNDPSYTNLTLPYRVVCRQRYRRAGTMQRAQFIKEIKLHELLQRKALDGVRIHREFCNPIIRQPMPEEMIRLTEKQKAKIEEILNRPFEG